MLLAKIKVENKAKVKKKAKRKNLRKNLKENRKKRVERGQNALPLAHHK